MTDSSRHTYSRWGSSQRNKPKHLNRAPNYWDDYDHIGSTSTSEKGTASNTNSNDRTPSTRQDSYQYYDHEPEYPQSSNEHHTNSQYFQDDYYNEQLQNGVDENESIHDYCDEEADDDQSRSVQSMVTVDSMRSDGSWSQSNNSNVSLNARSIQSWKSNSDSNSWSNCSNSNWSNKRKMGDQSGSRCRYEHDGESMTDHCNSIAYCDSSSKSDCSYKSNCNCNCDCNCNYHYDNECKYPSDDEANFNGVCYGSTGTVNTNSNGSGNDNGNVNVTINSNNISDYDDTYYTSASFNYPSNSFETHTPVPSRGNKRNRGRGNLNARPVRENRRSHWQSPSQAQFKVHTTSFKTINGQKFEYNNRYKQNHNNNSNNNHSNNSNYNRRYNNNNNKNKNKNNNNGKNYNNNNNSNNYNSYNHRNNKGRGNNYTKKNKYDANSVTYYSNNGYSYIWTPKMEKDLKSKKSRIEKGNIDLPFILYPFVSVNQIPYRIKKNELFDYISRCLIPKYKWEKSVLNQEKNFSLPQDLLDKDMKSIQYNAILTWYYLIPKINGNRGAPDDDNDDDDMNRLMGYIEELEIDHEYATFIFQLIDKESRGKNGLKMLFPSRMHSRSYETVFAYIDSRREKERENKS